MRAAFNIIDTIFLMKNKNLLKTQFLYFDKFYFLEELFDLTKDLHLNHYKNKKEIKKIFDEIDFLVNNQILIPISLDKLADEAKYEDFQSDKSFDQTRNIVLNHYIGFIEDLKRTPKGIDALVSTILRTHKMVEAASRTFSPVISRLTLDEVTPITENMHLLDGLQSRNESVISIVLNQFPVIDENISWEYLIQFKNDTETQRKFLALRNWMIDITKSDYSQIEIEEKMSYLLHDYNRHCEINKLKQTFSKLELIFFGAIDVVSNLPQLQLNKLIKPLIEFKKIQIALMESELTAPGKEIAYIPHINRLSNK